MAGPTIRLLRGARIAAAIALSGMLATCSTAPAVKTSASVQAEDRTAEALGAVNALRASRGLSPLTIAAPAQDAARRQAIRMSANRQMKHLIGFGESFGDRMKASNVPLPAAENIAAGQQTTDAVVKAWIASPNHLENMLGPSYRALGVAVARDTVNGSHPYWAMVLSR